jgi:hypothetical protein
MAKKKIQLIEAFGEGYKYEYQSLDLTRLPLKAIKTLSPEVIAEFGIILLNKMEMASALTIHVYGMLNPLDLQRDKAKLKPHIQSPLKAMLLEPSELFDILEKELKFPMREVYKDSRQPLHPRLFEVCEERFGKLSENLSGQIITKDLPETEAETEAEPEEIIEKKAPEVAENFSIEKILSRQGKRFDLITGIEIAIPLTSPIEEGTSRIETAMTMDLSHSGLKIYGDTINKLIEEQTYDMALALNSEELKHLPFKGKVVWKSDINDTPVAGVHIVEIDEKLKKTWNVLVSYSGMRADSEKDETR